MPHLVPIAQMGKLIPGEEILVYDRIAIEGKQSESRPQLLRSTAPGPSHDYFLGTSFFTSEWSSGRCRAVSCRGWQLQVKDRPLRGFFFFLMQPVWNTWVVFPKRVGQVFVFAIR